MHTAGYADTVPALLAEVYWYSYSLYTTIRQKSPPVVRGAKWKAAHGTYSRHLFKVITELSGGNRNQSGWA